MTTTATEHVIPTVPEERQPEPIFTAWPRHEGDVAHWPTHGVIVRRLLDDTLWLYHGTTLYPAEFGRGGTEPRWGVDGDQVPTSSVDPHGWTLTRFNRYALGQVPEDERRGIQPTLDEETRASIRAQILTLAGLLRDDAPEAQVDDEFRRAVCDYAERINERSLTDDMCGVYDSAQEKFNSRVSDPLRLVLREAPDIEHDIEVEVEYTVTGTVTRTVTVMASPDADAAELGNALDGIYLPDYISDEDVQSDVEMGYGSVDIDLSSATIVNH